MKDCHRETIVANQKSPRLFHHASLSSGTGEIMQCFLGFRSRKMGKGKDLSEFDMGQIVMARWLDQSISKTAALVGCSVSAVISIYQKWFKEGTAVNQRQGHGWPRLIDTRGERRLDCVVWSNRLASVAQIAQEVNVGSDIKVSEHTVHHSLLCEHDVFTHLTAQKLNSKWIKTVECKLGILYKPGIKIYVK